MSETNRTPTNRDHNPSPDFWNWWDDECRYLRDIQQRSQLHSSCNRQSPSQAVSETDSGREREIA